MSFGEFCFLALVFIGFGCLLGCSTGALVAVTIIALGLLLFLIISIRDRIYGRIAAD